MKKKELVRAIVNQYCISYVGTMLMTVLFCYLNQPKWTQLPVSYLWQAAIFCIFANLPTLVYYTNEELTKKQWWIRTGIHTILLEIVLLAAGYRIGMWGGSAGFIFFFLAVLAVDIFVRFLSYLGDRNTAQQINASLKNEKRRREDVKKYDVPK